jgi:hypothetical protein
MSLSTASRVGHQHLAAHVPALLHGSELILEVHACGARFDHRLHELERVQHAAEAGFGVGNDRREEVDVAGAFHVLDLVGAHERVVDALDDARHGIDGYSDWSGYISPAMFASAATCHPDR